MARTLNEAFSNATGEILIKTDCDPFVRSRGAIGELMTNFGDKRLGGATDICIAEKDIEKSYEGF
jgi:hypothetical protein